MFKNPLYNLSNIDGWHMLAKGENNVNINTNNFGKNWWELLLENKLPLYDKKITLNCEECSGVVIFNPLQKNMIVKRIETEEIYTVLGGKTVSVNNKSKNITLTSDTKFYLTKIGNLFFIILGIEKIEKGADLRDTELFENYLLMCGIDNKEQYLFSMGLENMEYFETKDWEISNKETGIKNDFTYLLLDLWERNFTPKKIKDAQKIPKIINWIWLRKELKGGPQPLKSKFYKFMKTWIERNPTFTFNIWTDNEKFKIPKIFEKIINIKGPNEIANLINGLPSKISQKINTLFKNHPNVGARSDVLRQVILYFIGGVYCDVNDSICLIPISELTENYSYFIGLEPVMYVNNAIIGSCQNHIISKNMIVYLADNYKIFINDWNTFYSDSETETKDDFIVSTTGPIALTEVIYGTLKQYPEKLNNVIIFPSSWVYPNYWIKKPPTFWLKPISLFAHYDQREYLLNK